MKDSEDQLRKKLGAWENKLNQFRIWADDISSSLANNADVVSLNITIVSNVAGESKVSVATITGDPTANRQLAETISSFLYGKKNEALINFQEIQKKLY